MPKKYEPHAVTVHVEPSDGVRDHGGYITYVSFTCTAPPDSQCRKYCLECSEVEGPCEHLPQAGLECYLTHWFGYGFDTTTYEGPDAENYDPPAVSKSGLIEVLENSYDVGLVWAWA